MWFCTTQQTDREMPSVKELAWRWNLTIPSLQTPDFFSSLIQPDSPSGRAVHPLT